MLINLSNHPAERWNAGQLEQAHNLYGEVQDLPFPKVDPHADEQEIHSMAEEYVQYALQQLPAATENAVHIMGEMTLTFALVKRLKAEGITCVASTTERKVAEKADGTKTSVFQFIRFREYQ